ncbi:MAG: C45 family autoproteolytic acyltransferase/hydrolase [Methanotrichaceae archaeon]|nr:C45 family autoproteolytic acyltransferase/hydrolase [Methanotrichaceae archaeon]
MKKICIAMLISLLALASLSSTYTMANAEGKTSGNSIIASTENPVIVKNAVLLKKDSVNYTELRHIVLKGTNEQIGKALGEIAREDYNVSLYSFADPIYAKARLIYMQKNDPAFYERMKGVAEAYNVPINSTNLDLSALIYDIGFPDCSIVYFSPSVTSNGHAMACRNNDYYTSPYEVIIGKTNVSSQPGMFSRTFVLELYPDEGYSSLVVGSNDLMSNSILQGFNSQGLAIEEQVDLFGANATNPSFGLAVDKNSGIPVLAAQRLILDTCKSIDEAKIALLNNKIYFGYEGIHFMIYDKYGNSTIAEFSPKNGSVHFIDAFNSIRVMTNHPVSLSRREYSIINRLPDGYYDSFRRYMTLTNITSNHTGKFTPKDMVDTLSSVNAEVTYKSMNLRTETNLLQDLTNSTISARFYLRDGPTDPVIGGPTNIFSKFFNFTLEKDPA